MGAQRGVDTNHPPRADGGTASPPQGVNALRVQETYFDFPGPAQNDIQTWLGTFGQP
jgi:hypothetical protein